MVKIVKKNYMQKKYDTSRFELPELIAVGVNYINLFLAGQRKSYVDDTYLPISSSSRQRRSSPYGRVGWLPYLPPEERAMEECRTGV